ncbi:Importin-5 [Phytophthora nicotianae]|uniref:Importin-5 n=1 Tax=Phytophthora nicotianae TaxID=4792 RepID=A0A0W8DLN5_PHYNI|nr:Importin-5 [Phytophthora nicotianae]
MREASTWSLAAGGLQKKWKGLKQRTAWRYKTLKDDDTAIVFCDEQEKEVHLKPRNRRLDDPLACHNVLAAASTASLNGILGATSPEVSSQFCRTMVGFMLHSCSPSERAKVLDVLTKQRLEEITIANRALVIRGIQHCLMSPLIRGKAVLHTAAKNVVCGTYELELSVLKEQIHSDEEAFIDTAGHFQFEDGGELERHQKVHTQEEPPHNGDLIQLIYGNKNITEVIAMMQHIAVESVKVKEQQPNLVKVVSDIDDTLFPGWIDKRYPLHIPYPGVSALYARLSRGLAQAANGENVRPSITFLTARPRACNVHSQRESDLRSDGDGGRKRAYAAEGVEFFGTYAGAALGAHKKGLISAEDVLAVADASEKELEEILFLGPEATIMKSERRNELQQDLDLIDILGYPFAIGVSCDGSRGSAISNAALVDGGELERFSPHLYPHKTGTLFACTNLATPLGTYTHAVLRDQDVAQLEWPLPTTELRAMVLNDN